MTSKFRQSIFSFDMDMDMDVDEKPKKMKAGKLRHFTKESTTKFIDSATAVAFHLNNGNNNNNRTFLPSLWRTIARMYDDMLLKISAKMRHCGLIFQVRFWNCASLSLCEYASDISTKLKIDPTVSLNCFKRFEFITV